MKTRRIFRTLEFFANIVKNHNYFSKALHLRTWTGFWIHISLNKYSLTCRVISRYVFYEAYSELFVNPDIFRDINALLRHIQPYCGILRTLRNSCIFRILWYWNLRYIQNSVNAYSGIFRTLCNCHIDSFAIFRNLAYLAPAAYSEHCLYRHVQSYLGIFDNDSYNNYKNIKLSFFSR